MLSLLIEVSGRARAISDRSRSWFGPRYFAGDWTRHCNLDCPDLPTSHILGAADASTV